MKSQTTWSLLGFAVCMVLAVGAQGPAKAGYVQSGPNVYELADDPADSKTSTMEQYSDVDTDAQEDGYCYCYVYTKSWAAAEDSASVYATGEGAWEIYWEWEGPPSTPAGGTLSWNIDADGHSEAWGETDPGEEGSAFSQASAESVAWIARIPAGIFSGGAEAHGSVQDSQMAGGGSTLYPEASWNGEVYNPTWGRYEFFVQWVLSAHDQEDIVASGTSLIQVLAGAGCTGTTYAYAESQGSGSEGLAHTYTQTRAFVDAAFTSN